MPAFFNGVFGHKPTTGKGGVGALPLPHHQRCHEVEWGLWDEPLQDTPMLFTGGIAVRSQITSCWDKPVEGARLGLAVGKLLVAEHQARGRRAGVYPSTASSAWDVFTRLGSAGCFSVFQCPDCVLFLPSPPHALCHQRLWGVQSLGNHISLHPETPQQCCPCLQVTLGVVSDFCALRGGAQRRPVPKRSGGADQLPVHGAHVPLRRGPGACAENHGRSWGQQVSFPTAPSC